MMLLVLCLIASISAKFLGQVNKIESDLMRVYLFPHSHDDVGWVKTLKQYYEMDNGVKQIIDSYMSELIKDPTKHFSQVEMAFFTLWWNAQNSTMHDIVKKLVVNGQLEFLSGGWCMNDEATAYYEDIIDQMTLGHKFLLENFDYVPTVGWQVDPFGHSNGQAMLSSMMGFNAWFFGRIDQEDRKYREQKKDLEFVIHPKTQSCLDYPILTHVNFYGYYSSPQGFDFDVMNSNRQKVTDQNVNRKADDLAAYFNRQQNSYRGKILAHTLGMDFQWSDAKSYFEQMDKVINIINRNTAKYNMTIQYGTPQQYIDELHQQNVTYSSQKEDFFPYQDYPNQYWSGYFTSRSSFKGYVKKTGRYFQQVKRLFSLLKINTVEAKLTKQDNILQLAQALGTSQHHDAITGTAKQYVNDDYIEMLEKAHAGTEEQMNDILNYLLSDETVVETQHVQCNFNGSHSCDAILEPLSQNKSVLLTLIDSKINNNGIKELIKFSVPDKMLISVLDEKNELVSGEIICIDKECTLFVSRTVDNTKLIHYYRITKVESEKFTHIVTIQPKQLTVTRDTQFFNKFKLQYGFYYSSGGGAYTFKPEKEVKPYGTIVSSLEFKGNIVQQIYVQTTATKAWITTTDEKVFYIDTFLDSVNIDDYKGKEVIIQVVTNIENNGIFYTDSNGLDLQKRQVNHRDSWKMSVLEPVAGNYFPVNGIIIIQNEQTHEAAALLNDRAQGGTSLSSGVLELMLQRRLLRDDNKGVYEKLDEKEEINGKEIGMRQMMSHTLVFYNSKNEPNKAREFQYQQDLKPLLYFATLKQPNLPVQYIQAKDKFATFIVQSSDINLCKFYIEPWIREDQYLIRVHNLREEGIQKLNFPNLTFEETTLTGNQLLAKWQSSKLKWSDTSNEQPASYQIDEVGPMQIRTWIVTI